MYKRAYYLQSVIEHAHTHTCTTIVAMLVHQVICTDRTYGHSLPLVVEVENIEHLVLHLLLLWGDTQYIVNKLSQWKLSMFRKAVLTSKLTHMHIPLHMCTLSSWGTIASAL